FPYMVYREQYQIMPIWCWQEVRAEPPGLNRQMSEYASWELGEGRVQSRPWRRGIDSYKLLCFGGRPLVAPPVLVLLPRVMGGGWLALRGAAWPIPLGA